MCLCRYLSNLNWRFARGEVTDPLIIMPSPSRISLGAWARDWRIGGLGGSPKGHMFSCGGSIFDFAKGKEKKEGEKVGTLSR